MNPTTLQLPRRDTKPRSAGITMVVDGGLPTRYFEDVVSSGAEYLDFVNGNAAGRAALSDGVRVVLVPRDSAAQRLMERTPGFAADGGDSRTSMYVRRA